MAPVIGLSAINGSGGPVAIRINGNCHDPEALATLVQRRVAESMNWRTHDTVSEYTWWSRNKLWEQSTHLSCGLCVMSQQIIGSP